MISSHVGTNSSTDGQPAAKGTGIPWGALLVLAVIGVVLYRAAAGGAGFDWARFGATLESLDPRFGALAILLIILSYVGRAVRWEVMIRPLGPTPSLWRLFVGTSIGFTAVVLLGRPGEFVRPWWIGRESRTTFSSQLAVWLFERIYDLLVVILFFGYGLVHLSGTAIVAKAGPELQFVFSSGGALALLAGSLCLLFIFALRFLNPRQREGLVSLVDRLPDKLAQRLRPLAGNFIAGAAACSDPKLQWLVLFYTAMEWLVIAGSVWAIFRAFPVSSALGVGDIVAFVGLVSFGSIVQLPGIGGGMQMAAIAVLTQLYGFGFEDATSLAIVIWITSAMLILPFGIAFALQEGLSLSSMRHLAEETR
nr:lysylphosphatidylglycerol synthase transmembrane domain-containing protein [Bryobacter aggregatus]